MSYHIIISAPIHKVTLGFFVVLFSDFRCDDVFEVSHVFTKKNLKFLLKLLLSIFTSFYKLE